MPTLRNGSTVTDRRLDRLPSARTDHLEKYPLTAATAPARATPVLGGSNWYSGMDVPTLRRIAGKTHWVLGDGPLGRFRGGHAYALRPESVFDSAAWWDFYNQGTEGRCAE